MSRLQDEVELEISVRRLREKFHGKISIDKAALLMRRYGNNHRIIAMEIVLMKDRELDDEDRHDLNNDITVKNVVEKLKAEEENHTGPQSHSSTGQASSQDRLPKSGNKPKANKQPNEDKDIQEVGQRLRILPLTEKNLRMFENAQRDLIPSDVHQFACTQCDSDWWRRVAQRKRVSRCFKCKRKYDPVPADKMWGIGEFSCPNCTRTFRGFGRMDLGSPCYGCRSIITPTQILPPRRNIMGPRTKNPHSCFAEDCYNRQEPHVRGTECVHPRSRQRNRKPRVVNPSPAHISSGSTVNTCLSQGSILDLYEHVREDVIYEDEEEEEEEEDDDDDDDADTDSSAGSNR
ncbi:hypothetical protein ACEWY4_003329 [Coilia grayii]|uniref:Shiftless antiviral inhibitor of ribosomal frameshifting protein n=1 Tax=Coilia grayii TaxID=363190 RepID=A0ABD1KS31_9TELE